MLVLPAGHARPTAPAVARRSPLLGKCSDVLKRRPPLAPAARQFRNRELFEANPTFPEGDPRGNSSLSQRAAPIGPVGRGVSRHQFASFASTRRGSNHELAEASQSSAGDGENRQSSSLSMASLSRRSARRASKRTSIRTRYCHRRSIVLRQYTTTKDVLAEQDDSEDAT